MIVPMKRVSLIVLAYEKRSALKALRKAGMVHIDEVQAKNEKIEDLERSLAQIDRIIIQLQELHKAEKKQDQQKVKSLPDTSQDDEEFGEMQARVIWLTDHEREVSDRRQKLIIERDRLQSWGDVSRQDLEQLSSAGIPLHFYRIGKKEQRNIPQFCDYVVLSSSKKSSVIATMKTELPEDLMAQKFTYGEYSLAEITQAISADEQLLQQLHNEMVTYTAYIDSFKRYRKIIEQRLRFEQVHSGMEEDDTVAWLSGYLPIDAVASFKETAKDHQWGYALDDPGEEELPPTKVKNRKWVSIISPVFDILGTVPGYREYDISMWFLLFFSLFFAMIVGDGAYGVIFLIAGIILHRKTKQATNAVILLYVLSITSIIWGAVTGTWFGSKAILEAMPFLQALVIPQIANYPELFGLSAQSAQNTVMQFCFIIGTLQLSLACVMNIYRKVGSKDLSAVGDIGWLLMIDALYFLVLMLVINASINVTVVATVVGIGFALVVLFGAQGPGIPFLKGLAGGAANLFTTFLNSISAFSNIISYIRLFAVGMASLAIAQSFNNMASGLLQGFALPAGILVLTLGHTLNLIMALLSVVVHGVRLNLLEFSGQLGMEWTGFTYDPFRETVETSSQTL